MMPDNQLAMHPHGADSEESSEGDFSADVNHPMAGTSEESHHYLDSRVGHKLVDRSRRKQRYRVSPKCVL